MRWFGCVATSYQWWGVGGEFPHLWRKSVDAAAILRHDFGNVNVIPLHQTCRKSSGAVRKLFWGGLFFIWKMMIWSFRMIWKIHPKPFWIPPKKIHLFGPQLSAATKHQPHRHQPISNPLQQPSGCHHWVPAIASHLPLPKHLSPGPEIARNARERTWVRQSQKGYGFVVERLMWKIHQNKGKRGVRGWCLMRFSDDFLMIFWWFLMIPDDFLMIFSWFLIIFRFKNDFPIVDLDFIYQATCRWRATFLVWSAPPTSTCTVWNWQNLTPTQVLQGWQ